ncbi:hypothetical protein NLI96_g11166 [Meripilus lineatus]|uniref:Uncharacterized protein n=1 Tax=Meripilus lineatus TaxID=2056292 RepID=A0AAD5Y9D8_9APHY|nr:hypothetical protein NLI96_g11166 [Physisporinus lineatus]
MRPFRRSTSRRCLSGTPVPLELSNPLQTHFPRRPWSHAIQSDPFRSIRNQARYLRSVGQPWYRDKSTGRTERGNTCSEACIIELENDTPSMHQTFGDHSSPPDSPGMPISPTRISRSRCRGTLTLGSEVWENGVLPWIEMGK